VSSPGCSGSADRRPGLFYEFVGHLQEIMLELQLANITLESFWNDSIAYRL
jgi:hypothetical protein